MDESEFEDFPEGNQSPYKYGPGRSHLGKFGVCHQVMLLCDNVLEQYPIAGLNFDGLVSIVVACQPS